MNEFLGVMFTVTSACNLVERRPDGSCTIEQESTGVFKKMEIESLFVYVRIKVVLLTVGDPSGRSLSSPIHVLLGM